MFAEVFLLMAVVHLLTRRRVVPDIATRAPARPVALSETLVVLAYGVLAMLGGFLLGHALGWHAFGFHLDGMVIRTHQEVVPGEALCWATYNLVVYAVLPFVVFRRRYSTEQLSLHSSNRRADLLLVLVVLVLEATVQLSLANSSILDLQPHQVLLGAPLTFLLGLAGTVLPTMVFIECILVPHYLKLTGSLPATVILGGLTYALLHFFDGWTNLTTATDALLSVLYLLLFYTGPGMFKTFTPCGRPTRGSTLGLTTPSHPTHSSTLPWSSRSSASAEPTSCPRFQTTTGRFAVALPGRRRPSR